MSIIDIAPLPMSSPVLQSGPDGKNNGLLSSDYYQTFFAMIEKLTLSVQQAADSIPSLVGQLASIGATQFPVGDVVAGVYRLSWYLRITQAATTSSSILVTFAWTDSGNGIASSGAALTTNTLNSTQSGSAVVRVDASTPLTYATTYASVGAAVMQYALTVSAEYLGP